MPESWGCLSSLPPEVAASSPGCLCCSSMGTGRAEPPVSWGHVEIPGEALHPGFSPGTSKAVPVLCPSLGGQKHVEEALSRSSRQDPHAHTRAGVKWISQEKTGSWRLWEVLPDLQQPSNRRCTHKNWKWGYGGSAQAGTSRKALEDSHGAAHGEGTYRSLWDPDEAEKGKEGECMSQGCGRAEDAHVCAWKWEGQGAASLLVSETVEAAHSGDAF